jgi:hypothetical protein
MISIIVKALLFHSPPLATSVCPLSQNDNSVYACMISIIVTALLFHSPPLATSVCPLSQNDNSVYACMFSIIVTALLFHSPLLALFCTSLHDDVTQRNAIPHDHTAAQYCNKWACLKLRFVYKLFLNVYAYRSADGNGPNASIVVEKKCIMEMNPCNRIF